MPKRSLIIFAFLFIAASYFVYLLPWTKIFDLTQEDNVFENYGAISCFLASVYFFLAWRVSTAGNTIGRWRTKRNFFFLVMALGLFFLAGEEISWGQRIFNFHTPAAWAKANFQQETNFHNLEIFDNAGGTGFNFMLTIAVLIYCGVIPFFRRIVPGCADFIRKVNLPLPPPSLCWLAMLVIVIGELTKHLSLYVEWWRSMGEIKESNLEFLFMMMGGWFYLDTLHPPREGRGK